MVIIFATITGRLLFLQVVKGQEYKEQSNNKSLTEIQEAAPRGKILDKNGNVLATNIQS